MSAIRSKLKVEFEDEEEDEDEFQFVFPASPQLLKEASTSAPKGGRFFAA
jgi:hypothetical protein